MREDSKEPHSRDGLQELEQSLLKLVESPPPAARSAVGELKVVRIATTPIELWVVIGKDSDYLVIRRKYCSCPHFVIRVVNNESRTPCYHLVAVEIAARTKRFHDLSLSLSRGEVADIVLEILAGTRSATLRRKLYRLSLGEKRNK